MFAPGLIIVIIAAVHDPERAKSRPGQKQRGEKKNSTNPGPIVRWSGINEPLIKKQAFDGMKSAVGKAVGELGWGWGKGWGGEVEREGRRDG